MAAQEIICGVCGTKNQGLGRCASCGAKLEDLTALTEAEREARAHEQLTFRWSWVAISVALFGVLQGIAIGLLPMVIEAYEPQGLAGLAISGAIWFVGGIVVGFVSPGRTFLEPVVAAILVAIPTVLWIDHITFLYPLSALSQIVTPMLGVMVTILGAFIGERMQMRAGG